MTTTKHTPGPWQAIRQKDWRHRCVSVMAKNGANRPDKSGHIEPGDALVASCADYHVTRETAEANAYLIAAAPELLEALAGILEDAETIVCHTPHLGSDYFDKARAAIAEATRQKDA